MSDIVKRLQDRQELVAWNSTGTPIKTKAVPDRLCAEAADEIKLLRSELQAERGEVFRLQASRSALYAEREADTALMRQALNALYSLVLDHVTVFSHETVVIDALRKRVGSEK